MGNQFICRFFSFFWAICFYAKKNTQPTNVLYSDTHQKNQKKKKKDGTNERKKKEYCRGGFWLKVSMLDTCEAQSFLEFQMKNSTTNTHPWNMRNISANLSVVADASNWKQIHKNSTDNFFSRCCCCFVYNPVHSSFTCLVNMLESRQKVRRSKISRSFNS